MFLLVSENSIYKCSRFLFDLFSLEYYHTSEICLNHPNLHRQYYAPRQHLGIPFRASVFCRLLKSQLWQNGRQVQAPCASLWVLKLLVGVWQSMGTSTIVTVNSCTGGWLSG